MSKIIREDFDVHLSYSGGYMGQDVFAHVRYKGKNVYNTGRLYSMASANKYAEQHIEYLMKFPNKIGERFDIGQSHVSRIVNNKRRTT